jgi:glycosyltransferase involved in cell wall biosynthesis
MIDSVLAQTYQDFELLIVDDGSTDNTRSLVESYVAKDSRVRYFYQENQRQSAARNLALKHVKGEFVCFLDSDNYWLPDKLEKSLAAFQQHPEADIVYGDCITVNEAGEEISRKNMRRHSGMITALLLKDNFISMNTTMTRKKCFDEMGGMSGKRRVADDYDLWLRFSARYRFLYVPEYMVYYRVMDDQISSDKRARFETNEQIIMDFLAQYPETVSKQQEREGLAAFYCRKARYYAGRSSDEAFSAIARAVGYNPLAVNVWRSLAKVMHKTLFSLQPG